MLEESNFVVVQLYQKLSFELRILFALGSLDLCATFIFMRGKITTNLSTMITVIYKSVLRFRSSRPEVFSCEFCEISKNTFFYRTPLVAAFACRLLQGLPRSYQVE